MNRGVMFFGLVLVMIGGLFIYTPMSFRSLVSTREWTADADAAEQKHRTRANYLGKSMALVGVAIMVYGAF
ncbi:hypothetical protein A4G99_05585 [Haladaptatus sp. R4]|uniref:hypothetical protein n=1 Tax=Haladaptatus sp. R4 TaxID=1679489 RepID=UPI0007B4D814|nr:hypothetical protein [Haladaptatus sp. R4]KZN25880.1 hypothetical protein A4G99_05585 [Haladaptatus sp. R4]